MLLFLVLNNRALILKRVVIFQWRLNDFIRIRSAGYLGHYAWLLTFLYWLDGLLFDFIYQRCLLSFFLITYFILFYLFLLNLIALLGLFIIIFLILEVMSIYFLEDFIRLKVVNLHIILPLNKLIFSTQLLAFTWCNFALC
jgi:hypothetical protein